MIRKIKLYFKDQKFKRYIRKNKNLIGMLSEKWKIKKDSELSFWGFTILWKDNKVCHQQNNIIKIKKCK